MIMREILFRAWHPESEEMVYFDAEQASRDEFIACHFLELMAGIHPTGQHLQQYTGLTDSKGVKIFEGDVVYIAGLGKELIEFPFIDLYEAELENDIGWIVGNIHQNPELLEGASND